MSDAGRCGADAPAPNIARWARHVPAGGAVLDVAAGGGRHARWFAARGHPVVAVDRDVERLRAGADPRIEVLAADLEHAPWPFAGRRFAAVVVVNYPSRPSIGPQPRPALRAGVIEGRNGNLPWALRLRKSSRGARIRVTTGLWRPLLPMLVASVATGGVLLYDTFMVCNERFGRPRNPDFLLRAGELREVVRHELEVVESGEGQVGEPAVSVRQWLCARRI